MVGTLRFAHPTEHSIVIASAAKQSILRQAGKLDCFAALAMAVMNN
jgi:hypothetical protein